MTVIGTTSVRLHYEFGESFIVQDHRETDRFFFEDQV
jgi:hypothetical protein